MKILLAILLALSLVACAAPVVPTEEQYDTLFSRVQSSPRVWHNANLGIKGKVKRILVGDLRGGWEEWQGKFLGSASGIVITELQPYAIEFDILETDSYVYGVYVSTGGSGVPHQPNILVPVRYLYPTLRLGANMFMDFKVQGGDVGDFKGMLLSAGDEFYGRLFVNEQATFVIGGDPYYGHIAPMWRRLVIQ